MALESVPSIRPVGAINPVYTELRAQIVDGRLLGGERLKETEVAERAGVSRTPVRLALQLLERDGLVQLLPNRGAIVIGWTSQACEEIFEMRAVIEGYAASRAAMRISPEVLEALQTGLDEQQRAMEIADAEARADRLVELNVEFHRLIADAAGSTLLKRIAGNSFDTPAPIRRRLWALPEHSQTAFMCHREIVAALRVRDPIQAEAVMRTHMFSARCFFMELFEQHARERA